MDVWEPMIRILTLAMAAHTLWPDLLPMPKAIEHASAAVSAAEKDHLDPEMLLAIARCETGFRSTDVSRKDGRTGKRKTGLWPSQKRAPYFVAPYFCGVLQAKSNSWYGCLDLRTVRWAYEKGADELREWLDDARCLNDPGCALAGHGNGNNGVSRYRYPTSTAAKNERERLKERHHASKLGECDRSVPYYEAVLDQWGQLAAIRSSLSLPKPVASPMAFE